MRQLQRRQRSFSICKFHLRVDCRNGSECWYVHTPTCEDWLNGTCPYPDGKCLFPHRVNVITNTDDFDGLVMDDLDESTVEDFYQEANNESVASS